MTPEFPRPLQMPQQPELGFSILKGLFFNVSGNTKSILEFEFKGVEYAIVALSEGRYSNISYEFIANRVGKTVSYHELNARLEQFEQGTELISKFKIIEHTRLN